MTTMRDYINLLESFTEHKDAEVVSGLWHGSPGDFERFSDERRGRGKDAGATGSGNQIYGLGHYFTDSRSEALMYANGLSHPRFTLGGVPFDASRFTKTKPMAFFGDDKRWKKVDPEMLVGRMVTDGVHKPGMHVVRSGPQRIDGFRAQLSWNKSPGPLQAAAQDAMHRILDRYEKNGFTATEGAFLYGVTVNAPYERFIDYDTAINQSGFVRSALDRLRAPPDSRVRSWLAQSGFRTDLSFTRKLLDVGIEGIRHYSPYVSPVPGEAINYAVFDASKIRIVSKEPVFDGDGNVLPGMGTTRT